MEAVHAELVRLATELEAVKGQVQTESNALRDLFARTTTVMSGSGPQHDRRLNHREAGRHLPLQFDGSWLDYGDLCVSDGGLRGSLVARWTGWCAVERSCQTGKVRRQHDRILGEELLGYPTIECGCGSRSDHMHPRRGGNTGKEDSQCEPWRRAASLACSHAKVQAQISGGTGCADGETSIAKRAKNVNELQVAVMQWELTLVEFESTFPEVVADSVKTAAMRAMLPKDILERFLDGPFHYEELRNRVSAYVGEKLAGQDASGGAQPMDIGQIDKSEGEDEDVNAVQQRRPFDRSSPTMSENPSTVGLPTRHHQHHASRPTRQEIGE